MNRQKVLPAIVVAVALVATVSLSTAIARTFDAGTEVGAEYTPAQPIVSPEPIIPAELKEDAQQWSCQARFKIDSSGAFKVSLVTSSGSDEIDDITVKTLRQWRFKPAMLDGKPVDSARRIRIEFKVD